MSGVHLQRGPDSEPTWDPVLSPNEVAFVAGLNGRHGRDGLTAGIAIAGPTLKKAASSGAGTINTGSTSTGATIGLAGTSTTYVEYTGALGVLLEDAHRTDIAYALVAMHVLSNGAIKSAGLDTLQLGHPVYQPEQLNRSVFAGINRIGWLIALYHEFDVALIGIRPGLTWRPVIEGIGPTQGAAPFLLSADKVGSAGPPAARTVQEWDYPTTAEPVLGVNLPTSGPVVRKVGPRTGLTTGRAYLLERDQGVDGYQRVFNPYPPFSGGSNEAAWNVLAARTVQKDPSATPHSSASLDPLTLMCVPDPASGASPTSPILTSFQQKGDSGAALVDVDGAVVGLIANVRMDLVASNHIPGMAQSIDQVLAALQEEFDDAYGPVSRADWPAPRVPRVGAIAPPVRRVPKNPPPAWYELALPSIQAAKI